MRSLGLAVCQKGLSVGFITAAYTYTEIKNICVWNKTNAGMRIPTQSGH